MDLPLSYCPSLVFLTSAGLTDEELQKQQEKKEEEDDEETLQKARNMDDWKDTHPRGYGNRHNMG